MKRIEINTMIREMSSVELNEFKGRVFQVELVGKSTYLWNGKKVELNDYLVECKETK